MTRKNKIPPLPYIGIKKTSKLLSSEAQIPGQRNVFSIGPYGRVSFESQQRRALIIVRALLENKDIKPADTIAVIGGGIAGIMASVALTNLGCHVTLYEKHPEVLTIQKSSTHRVIHPSIAAWPCRNLEDTSQLPFFDWYVDNGSEIVKQLTKQWEPFEDFLSGGYFNTTVESIKSNDKTVEVIASGKFGKQGTYKSSVGEDYQAVIITTGFGPCKINEKSQTTPYWDPDTVNTERGRGVHKFYVSGTGDGGLFEALRLIHGDFNGGKKIIETADVIQKQMHPDAYKKFKGDIKKIEDSYKNSINSNLTKAKKNKLDVTFYDEYKCICKLLNAKVKNCLTRKICNKGRVILVGKNSIPFDTEAAPIHKIMITNAIEENFITYIQGKAVYDAEDKLKIKDGEPDHLDPVFHIERHGSRPPLKDIFPTLNLDEFTKTLAKLSSDLLEYDNDAPIATEDYYTKTLDYTHSFENVNFMNNRRVQAQRYLREAIGYDDDENDNFEDIALEINNSSAGYIAENRGSNKKVAEFINENIFPKNIFGVSLTWGEPETAVYAEKTKNEEQ